jgi:RNA polymerase sigma factor (sigma-70 family)
VGAATSGVYEADDIDVSSGDAFVALYRAHASFTWSCLRRLGVPPASIDDAMQELWITAHRRLSSLHSPAAAKSWLFGIARRVVSHQRRTEGRHRRKVDAFGASAQIHEQAERESAMIVEGMLAALDERVREAFVLSEIEGWTAPEIARATGANTNTIYWRVRTAKDQLQRRLGDRDLDAEVIELRAATKPSKKALAHCWMILVPKLGKAPLVATIFAGWSAAKLAVVGAGITALVATGVEVGRRASVETPSVVASSEPPRVVARPDAPPPAAMPAAVLPAAVPVQTPVAAPVAAPPVQRPSVARAQAPTPIAKEEAKAPAIDVTAADTKLLSQAKLAFTEGRTADACAHVAAHREQFPDSKLATVRERLEASCASK